MASTPHAAECAGTRLTSGDLIGLTLTTEAGLVSAAAIIVLACIVGRHALRNLRDPACGQMRLVNTHLDVYMLSLLVSDFLQAVGGIMDIRWISARQVTCGHYCTAQGAIQTLGEPGVAMATLAIAIHTFCVIAFQWTPPKSFVLPLLVVGTIWAFVGLYVGLAYAAHHAPATGDAFFAPTPYWCWIAARFAGERISAEYVWLWAAAVLSLALYVPLFFFIRGNLFVRARRVYWRHTGVPTASAQSRKMLLYPATYIGIVLPLTVTRWIGFTHPKGIASFWTFLGVALFGLSGVTNVLLLTLTRPSILAFGGSARAGIAPRVALAWGAVRHHSSQLDMESLDIEFYRRPVSSAYEPPQALPAPEDARKSAQSTLVGVRVPPKRSMSMM